MFTTECAIRGSAEKWQIHTQWWHFCRLVVTVHFDDISLEKYGQLIIKSLSCSSLDVLLGFCRKVANSYAVVTLFKANGYCGFWWYFIRKLWSVDYTIIIMFIIECAMRGSAEKWQIHTQWSHFCRLAVTVVFDDISLEKYVQLII